MHREIQQGLNLREVLGELVGRHSARWLGFVERMLRNAADAQDVLQEAVCRVLVAKRSFSSENDVRMYLSRAISNRAIELYHSRRRERLRQIPLEEHLIARDDAVDPEQYMVQSEKATERLRAASFLQEGLARLPLKQYEAIRMTLLASGCASMREAGVESGIPYSTLRHRSIQGIRRLRRHIHRAIRTAGHTQFRATGFAEIGGTSWSAGRRQATSPR